METVAIELLESRIAPAKVSILYTDADGDIVKITANRTGLVAPALTENNLVFSGGDPDGQLLSLIVTDPSFTDASITFTVKKKPGGDGLAHVGFIDATGIDLNMVTVKGDLGRIIVGDTTTADNPGLNLLAVRSLGVQGLMTQGGTGDLKSVITGKLGALKVTGDLVDASVQATAASAPDGEIGSVFIGGDLLGGVGIGSGVVRSSGAMGNVQVKGSVLSGTGPSSGQLSSSAALGDVTIGKDLEGSISSGGTLGKLRIGGDVAGVVEVNAGIESVRIKGDLIGTGPFTGRVSSNGPVGNVWIGGDVTADEVGSGEIISQILIDRVEIKGDLKGSIDCLVGSIGLVKIGGDVIGTKSGTGVISGSNIDTIRIGGDLMGGSISESDSLVDSGTIVGGVINNVTIKGSLIAGTDNSTGAILRSGGIFAGRTLGVVKIEGSVLGNDTAAALIIAKGQENKPATGLDLVIGSVSVGGDVKFARILGGFDELENPANADASIGKVTVGRNWEASSLVAGAQDYGVPGFGSGDALQSVGDTELIARIESITIKRSVLGSAAAGDHFGFVAQQIGSLKIDARLTALTEGPGNDDVAIGDTDDVRLLEVS